MERQAVCDGPITLHQALAEVRPLLVRTWVNMTKVGLNRKRTRLPLILPEAGGPVSRLGDATSNATAGHAMDQVCHRRGSL